MAAIFAGVLALADLPAADLLASVPKRPDRDYDRFAAVRPAVAKSAGAEDAGDLLEMVKVCEDYKSLDHDSRREANQGRFEVAEELLGRGCPADR